MPLEFHDNAIVLSGMAGTKLKCDVIGHYYPFWWGITSGGQNLGYRNRTAIIELNAASGEVYIKEAQETLLGSAGHALELKTNNTANTQNLLVVLIENDNDCYANLRQVIARRWPSINLKEAEGPVFLNKSGIYLLKKDLKSALSIINTMYLGNSLYFFDPLRRVEYSTISEVASKRILTPFETGTEFFIFSFTSDWFLGRKDFVPLPNTTDEKLWSTAQSQTVQQADDLFGSVKWRKRILVDNLSVKEKERMFLRLYKHRLYRWFRYVLPLPFNPKEQQLFHIILCSNYEAGVRMTRDHYTMITGNQKYSPNNDAAFVKFRSLHPNLFATVKGNRRPPEWRILWKIIREHEGGLSDYLCKDLIEDEPAALPRIKILQWLLANDYLTLVKIGNAWESKMDRYRIKWSTITAKLGVPPPPKLHTISPQKLNRITDKSEG